MSNEDKKTLYSFTNINDSDEVIEFDFSKDTEVILITSQNINFKFKE